MTRLVDRYSALVCDLDGVVYRGPTAVPHAIEALRTSPVPVIYATNNASRPPADVAAHLRELGLDCEADDVVTSSQAAAWLLADEIAPGERVLVVGGVGVADAVTAAGFVAVRPDEIDGDRVAAVVQGYGPDVRATDLAAAAYAVQGGARWVATNLDLTLPTDRGTAPGNGSLVGAVRNAVGREPHVVAGKPEVPVYRLAAERLGVEVSRVLAVGDRLDTDIEGANRAGCDSLLVLTGVDDVQAVLAAGPALRPTRIAPDLRWLARDAEGDGGVDATAAVLSDLQSPDGDAAGRLHRLVEEMTGR